MERYDQKDMTKKKGQEKHRARELVLKDTQKPEGFRVVVVSWKEVAPFLSPTLQRQEAERNLSLLLIFTQLVSGLWLP